jgi:hypothetical protein
MCHAVTVLVLLQAMIAGMFISGEDPQMVDEHELLANVLFLAVVVQLILGFLVRDWSRLGLWLWVLVLLVLVIAQTGLGYVGRDEAMGIAIHVPLGVFIFGFSMLISVMASIEDRLASARG